MASATVTTGTAQAQNYGAGSRKGAGRPWSQKDHNLFIAFAPAEPIGTSSAPSAFNCASLKPLPMRPA